MVGRTFSSALLGGGGAVRRVSGMRGVEGRGKGEEGEGLTASKHGWVEGDGLGMTLWVNRRERGMWCGDGMDIDFNTPYAGLRLRFLGGDRADG